MKTAQSDPRFELACRILANWDLEQIVNQPSAVDGVAALALNLAEKLIEGALYRGWIADPTA